MARRSDHTRDQLREMILSEAHRHMAEVGFHRFSAREVAKRIGYTVGTVYNVFGTLDALLIAVNSRTMAMWARQVARALDGASGNRLMTLVQAYFDFAVQHRWLWLAINEHHIPDDMVIPEDDAQMRSELTAIITDEVHRAAPGLSREDAYGLTRSLIATVHGHCAYAVNGNFARMGEERPVEAAFARVMDSIRASSANRMGIGDAPC